MSMYVCIDLLASPSDLFNQQVPVLAGRSHLLNTSPTNNPFKQLY